ncbi:MAG: T9SS type A sorting domain-containing protein, partial [Chitinophagales bacterium]
HNTLMAIINNRYSTVGVYKTTDGGDTWTLKTSTDIQSYQGWYSKGLLMKSNDATKVIAGGVSLYQSSNSGTSFGSIGFNVHSDIHDVIANPLDPNKIYVITDGGLYRSKNFGNTFDDCNDGLVTSQHYIGAVSHQDASVAISGLQDNSTVTYSGSVYWGSVIGGDGTYTAIDPNNDNVQYGAYQYLNIYKTTNQWNNYNEIFYSSSSAYGGNPAAFLAPYIICPSNTSVIYAGSSTLYKSTNGGNSFSNVQPDPLDSGNAVLSIASSSLSSDTVYFSTAPTDSFPMHVYRSFNGGSVKSDISSGLPNRYPQRITVNPHNAQEVYVVFSGFNGSEGGHIFKSEDAGSTWSDISTSLPDVPFHCLMIDPDHTSNIYAGCDFTVYVSSNGGTDWFTYADGLPDAAMVFDLVISPSDNSLFAFTYGNGVYKNDLLDDAVGVNEVSSQPSVSVFPNPVNDVLSMKFSSALGEVNASLYDASGKILMQRKLFAVESFNWDVHELPSGTYFLQLHSKGWSSTQKVMVIR